MLLGKLLQYIVSDRVFKRFELIGGGFFFFFCFSITVAGFCCRRVNKLGDGFGL